MLRHLTLDRYRRLWALTLLALSVAALVLSLSVSAVPYVAAGGAMMLLASATSPPVVRRVMATRGALARRRVTRPAGATPVPATEVAACLEAMSGAELCRLWATSFSLVKSPTDLSQRMMGAGLRLSLLDELERRDSEGFTSWLARHPSPASEPRWVEASGHGARSQPRE